MVSLGLGIFEPIEEAFERESRYGVTVFSLILSPLPEHFLSNYVLVVEQVEQHSNEILIFLEFNLIKIKNWENEEEEKNK